MRRPRAAPLVLRRNALTRRPPFYALVVFLFMAVFRNLDLPKDFKLRVGAVPGPPHHIKLGGHVIRGQVCQGKYVVKVRTGAATFCNKVKDEHIEHHVHA